LTTSLLSVSTGRSAALSRIACRKSATAHCLSSISRTPSCGSTLCDSLNLSTIVSKAAADFPKPSISIAVSETLVGAA
jgi:hypothetical protein